MENTEQKIKQYYKCVKCQEWHWENEQLYKTHLKHQSKEGILTEKCEEVKKVRNKDVTYYLQELAREGITGKINYAPYVKRNFCKNYLNIDYDILTSIQREIILMAMVNGYNGMLESADYIVSRLYKQN